MSPPRVWINYKPRIYTELLTHLFQSMGLIEAVEIDPTLRAARGREEEIDVVLLSLDYLGQPDLEIPGEGLKKAKVIAFSPKGDYGLRRLPGKTNWEEIRPFGLKQLMDELACSGSGKWE